LAPDRSADAAQRVGVTGNRRIAGLRSRMMLIISASVAFGILAGFIAWQANANTYAAYHKIVDEGSVSVDAALRARAAVLDHMSAAATFLETTGTTQDEARKRAEQRWADYNNESRISWRNVSDQTHGENNVYQAADSASSDYIQQIGAMFAYYDAGDKEKAGQAFLQARETLNNRLIPALGGLEAVKVEAMEATYAGAEQMITRWRYVLVGVAVLLVLIFLAGLLAVRRMHYAWSWPVGIALIVAAGIAIVMQFQLAQASADARVMVREAYDSIAGVQDLAALLSQGRALESIAIFDPEQSSAHLESFDQYNSLVEQKLCGPRDCTINNFLLDGVRDTISPVVLKLALDEQSKLGLPKPPLVANVHFPDQARRYETLRANYRIWLDAHKELSEQVKSGQLDAASATSAAKGAETFAELASSVDASVQVARDKFNNIWEGVYRTSTINQGLALVFVLCGGLCAYGVWSRRAELFR
jgi:hypothetical protein